MKRKNACTLSISSPFESTLEGIMAEWNRNQKLAQLAEWANSGVVKIDCEIRAGDGADGAGLYALNDAAESQILVEVPATRVLTRATVIEHAKNHEFLSQLLYRDVRGEELQEKEKLEGVSDKDILTRFFIYEILTSRRGDTVTSDNWLAWVECLPSISEMNLPISWDRQDIEDLVGTSIYEATLSKINFLKFRYKRFFESEKVRTIIGAYVNSGPNPDKKLDTNGEITFKEWLLIESWIASRSLEVVDPTTLEEETKSLCLGLVPIVDMCNHSNGANAKYELDSETGAVSLVATKPIKKGEQFYINYGEEKGSGEMLFSYGFIPDSSLKHARVATFTIPDLIGEDDDLGDEEAIVLKAKDRMFGARPRLLKVVHLAKEQDVTWTSDYITFLALPPTDFSFAEIVAGEEANQVVLFRGNLIDFDNLSESLGGVMLTDKAVKQRANYMAESLVRDVFEADLADEEGQENHDQATHPLVLLEKALLSSVKFTV